MFEGGGKPSENPVGVPNYVLDRNKIDIHRVDAALTGLLKKFSFEVRIDSGAVKGPPLEIPLVVRALQISEAEAKKIGLSQHGKIRGLFRGETRASLDSSLRLDFESASSDLIVLGLVKESDAADKNFVPNDSQTILMQTTGNAFAFGNQFFYRSGSVPVPSGFTQVLPATRYDENRGYGWVAGDIQLNRVFPNLTGPSYSSDATFGVRLPKGFYEVIVDWGYGLDAVPNGTDSVVLSIEGTTVSNIDLTKNETDAGGARSQRKVFDSYVTDGRLDVRFVTNAASPKELYVNSISVRPVEQLLVDFNPGPDPTIGARVPEFNLGTSKEFYAPAIGFGWLPSSVFLSPLSFAFGVVNSVLNSLTAMKTGDGIRMDNGTFSLDLPNGAYEVTTILGSTAATGGNAGAANYRVSNGAGSIFADVNGIEAGGVRFPTFDAPVTAGKLNLNFAKSNALDMRSLYVQGVRVASAPNREDLRITSFSRPGRPSEGLDRVYVGINQSLPTGDLRPFFTLQGSGPIAVDSVRLAGTFTRVYEVHFAPQSAAGEYRLEIQPGLRNTAGVDLGGAEVKFSISAPIPPKLTFDFDAPTTPRRTLNGAIGVLPSDVYRVGAEFGWTSSAIYSESDGISQGDPFRADYHWGMENTFVARVPPGPDAWFDVTTYIVNPNSNASNPALRPAVVDRVRASFNGDFFGYLDQMFVPQQGGVPVALTHTVRSKDGVIEFRFEDEGGAFPFVMFSGIEIYDSVK